jgi:hypothetical protein
MLGHSHPEVSWPFFYCSMIIPHALRAAGVFSQKTLTHDISENNSPLNLENRRMSCNKKHVEFP